MLKPKGVEYPQDLRLCAWVQCKRYISYKKMFCHTHWNCLPIPLRQKMVEAYYQHTYKGKTTATSEVMNEIRTWINSNKARYLHLLKEEK